MLFFSEEMKVRRIEQPPTVDGGFDELPLTLFPTRNQIMNPELMMEWFEAQLGPALSFVFDRDRSEQELIHYMQNNNLNFHGEWTPQPRLEIIARLCARYTVPTYALGTEVRQIQLRRQFWQMIQDDFVIPPTHFWKREEEVIFRTIAWNRALQVIHGAFPTHNDPLMIHMFVRLLYTNVCHWGPPSDLFFRNTVMSLNIPERPFPEM